MKRYTKRILGTICVTVCLAAGAYYSSGLFSYWQAMRGTWSKKFSMTNDLAEKDPCDKRIIALLAESVVQRQAHAITFLSIRLLAPGACRDFGDVKAHYSRIQAETASHNNCENHLALGVLHETGIGTVQNVSSAFSEYQKSASLGCADAEYLLWHCYNKGIGVKRNKKMALDALGRAVLGHSYFAALELSSSYGRSTNRDDIRQSEFWRGVAEKEMAKAFRERN